MIGAVVNNKIVPLNYVLEDNDVVKINTSKSSTGPKLSWLKITKLTQTKNKIKTYFGRERKEEIIKFGLESLEKYLRRKHISKVDFYKEENLKQIFKELKCKDLQELYLNLGNNKFSPKSVVEVIYKPEVLVSTKKELVVKNNTDIKVSGIDNIRVNIASCCMPIPGDKIIGFITKNNGITIHRSECLNVLNHERVVDVSWQDETKNKYLVKIKIYTSNNNSNLADIINKLTSNGIIINNVVTNIIDLKYNYEIVFGVKNLVELDNIIRNMIKLDYVVSVERVIK